ncbi:MAG: polysaccharide deacetylase family protein [Lachnospiraceae bacterium]|nr:polysaccharide deacetylase family protein [Lachnospiraceae bacterium]
MEDKKNKKGIEFQRSRREEFHYQKPEVNRIIMPDVNKKEEKPKKKKMTKAQVQARKRRRRRKKVIRAAIYALMFLVAVLGVRQVRIIHKERVAAREAKEAMERKKAAEAKIKRNKWVKKNGKSYYYGKDGKVLTGRFVQDEKIYYTDKKGAVTKTVDGTKPMVALTFDDGPSQFTDDIVKILEKHHSAGTFFEVGSRIADFEEETQAVVDSYSELANHTYSHQILTKVGTSEIKSQTERCTEVLKKAGETNRILFRAPGGGVNDAVKQNISMPIILWSVDTLDWKSRNAQSVYEKATANIEDGDVILMHSLYESTYEAVKNIVPTLKEQGYQLVTVTDLIEFRGGAKDGQVYMNFPPLDEGSEGEISEE